MQGLLPNSPLTFLAPHASAEAQKSARQHPTHALHAGEWVLPRRGPPQGAATWQAAVQAEP